MNTFFFLIGVAYVMFSYIVTITYVYLSVRDFGWESLNTLLTLSALVFAPVLPLYVTCNTLFGPRLDN